MTAMFDAKTATKAELIAKAHKMLDLAIKQEDIGKQGMCEKAFGRAAKFEDLAFDGRD